MAWIKRTAATYRDLVNDITSFAQKATKAETAVPGANTGDGTLVSQSSTQDSVLETITFTCTTGGASAVFSVSGSVTGALPSANVNETYSESVISVVIGGGDVDYIIGDSFTVAVSAESAKWSVNRLINTPGSEYEALLQGVGYSGVEEIFVGIQSWENGTPKGLRVNAFTGYIPENTFSNQPGRYPDTNQLIPTIENNIEYWLHVSPQSISCNMASGTAYLPFYIGWINQYASPSQYIYPITIGYSSSSTTASYTSPFTVFWSPGSAKIRILDTTGWEGSPDEIEVEPQADGHMRNITQNEDGSVPHFPAELVLDSASKEAVYGQFEGISIPATLQEALTVEDMIIEDTTSHVVMQDDKDTGTLALFELKGDV